LRAAARPPFFIAHHGDPDPDWLNACHDFDSLRGEPIDKLAMSAFDSNQAAAIQ
jgi:hypothetical protein